MWEDPVYEPHEPVEFHALLETAFKASQASFLDKLHNFVTIPHEGLLELADRFNENSIPLLAAGLITIEPGTTKLLYPPSQLFLGPL